MKGVVAVCVGANGLRCVHKVQPGLVQVCVRECVVKGVQAVCVGTLVLRCVRKVQHGPAQMCVCECV